MMGVRGRAEIEPSGAGRVSRIREGADGGECPGVAVGTLRFRAGCCACLDHAPWA